MITSFLMGNKIVYKDYKWIYTDGSSTNIEKPCVRCGRNSVNGNDPCIGKLYGVSSACCGHGINGGYIIKE